MARIAYDQTVPVDQVIEKSEAAVFAVSEGKGDGGMIPMRRYGSTEEVAAVVGFLHSTAASYLTGVNIEISGGSS